MKRLALSLLFVSLAPSACSSSNSPAQSNGAGGSPPTSHTGGASVGGNANGTGGLAANSGGNQATGGAISTGGVAPLSAGGAHSSTGGAPSSNGGATFATGGMAAGGVNGSYYVNSPWAGYIWTASCTGSSISGDFSTHTTGSPYCVSGSVAPASDYSGCAMLGWNINQAQGSSTPNGTWTPTSISSGGVLISVSNPGGSTLRVQIQGPNGSTDASDNWCAVITGTGGLIPWTSFNTACWDNSGTVYAGQPLSQVEVTIPGSNTAAVPFSFCLNSLGVQSSNPNGGTGGAPLTGGASSIGGAGGAATSGGTKATGGHVATGGNGGAVAVTGGATATGGHIATGGNGVGGAVVTGGAMATGGHLATGGMPATGGLRATGGTTNTTTTTTFYPTADNVATMSNSNTAVNDTVYSTGSLLTGCSWTYGTLQLYYCNWSFIQFGLTTLNGRTISSAWLRLYPNQTPLNPDTYFIGNATGSWSGSTLTANNAPNWDIGTTFLSPSSVLYPIDFDVTYAVQQWASGQWPNYGFVLGPNSTIFPYATLFSTTEWDSSDTYASLSTRPQLIVTYQ